MPTISDVAKRAGVSAATVSRVLQGASNVRPNTRERVQQAINELGYVPSAAAQSLRSKRTRSFALVVPDITNSFWTTIVRGVEDVAHRHDYSVLLCNTDEDPTKQERYLGFLISRGVDGVIIAPRDSDVQRLGSLRERNIPTVFIDRRIDDWEMDSVTGDSVSGARAMVQHLLALNHQRIAIISGPEATSTAEDRIQGYRLALEESGIPVDPTLIKRGEYQRQAGETLAIQLLKAENRPTAIFAANNSMAVGVIDAVAKVNLQIPQDVAVVSFDDLPNVSRLFPFLTVITQPAYEMGVNAAQLLLSRMQSEVKLRPRHVTLPTRLVVRHSCGSRLEKNGKCPISLPMAEFNQEQQFLVKPFSATGSQPANDYRTQVEVPVVDPPGPSDYDKSDINRLLKALRHEEADRLPYLELNIASQRAYEYILERELEKGVDWSASLGPRVHPGDQVDFALRLGMDAVACPFIWHPQGQQLSPPPSLADQLSQLERYLRAIQGTKVGVIPRFSGFFWPAVQAAGLDTRGQNGGSDLTLAESLMDKILAHQEMVMRVVCDRFAESLACVMVVDEAASFINRSQQAGRLAERFFAGLARLVTPAQEHGKLLLYQTRGDVNPLLAGLVELGIDGLHPLDPECNNLFDLKPHWQGKMAFLGNLSAELLVQGTEDEILAAVREACTRLAPGGGFILSSAAGITTEVPPENLMILRRAVQIYGRYGALGQSN